MFPIRAKFDSSKFLFFLVGEPTKSMVLDMPCLPDRPNAYVGLAGLLTTHTGRRRAGVVSGKERGLEGITGGGLRVGEGGGQKEGREDTYVLNGTPPKAGMAYWPGRNAMIDR